MMMRRRSRNGQSIDSLSWTKRLLGVWNLENIKVVKRVTVSVVGATVLLIRRCTAGFAWPSVHRHSDRPGYSCHRVRVGAALAKKSSSHGERCCFRSRPNSAARFSYLALRWLAVRINQNACERPPLPLLKGED